MTYALSAAVWATTAVRIVLRYVWMRTGINAGVRDAASSVVSTSTTNLDTARIRDGEYWLCIYCCCRFVLLCIIKSHHILSPIKNRHLPKVS
jgi:hypothetical protein